MDYLQNSFCKKVDENDNQLEFNLSTMISRCEGKQTVLVFKKNLNCSAWCVKWGSPTFFLIFSCAEYDSKDIANYLHKINNVPFNHPIGKLCAEDPISVSRKFSKKFHDFFQTVILKGLALGKVNHFYWKKKY